MKIPFPTFLRPFPRVEELYRQLQDCFDLALTRTEPYAVTSSYTFKDNDTVDSLQVDATSGNLVAVLPSPSGNRRRRVIKTDASGNTVTVVGTINGATNYVLVAQYDYITVEPTGSGWLIVGS